MEYEFTDEHNRTVGELAGAMQVVATLMKVTGLAFLILASLLAYQVSQAGGGWGAVVGLGAATLICLAIGFWTFGLNPWLPRLLAFVGGVATVGATWWLGRVIGGRVGGVVAARLKAGCSTQNQVNTHLARSPAPTPRGANHVDRQHARAHQS